jgi:hypothetical protein
MAMLYLLATYVGGRHRAGARLRLEDGCAPAPFTEKLATYRVRLRAGALEADPRPLPPGTPAALDCPMPPD